MPTYSNVIVNPGFESGDTGWTKGTGWSIEGTHPYSGTQDARYDGATNSQAFIEAIAYTPVTPGIVTKLSCQVAQGNNDYNTAGAAVHLRYYDSAFALILDVEGNRVITNNHNDWNISQVTGTAPAGAAYMRPAALGFRTSETYALWVDDFQWDYVFNRTIQLTQPVNGDTFVENSVIGLHVSIGGTSPDIESVVYKDGVTTLATETSPNYAFNIATLAVGSHALTAELHLVGGLVITSNTVTITVTATPPTTREFKASNAYTYLVASNFAGLANSIPSIANVTAAEIVVDYTIRALIRSKDIGMVDPAGSNINVAFDITSGADIEATLLTPNGANFDLDGTPIVSHVPLDRSDFTVIESGTSEGKAWTILDSTPGTVTMGSSTEFFGVGPIEATDFVSRSLGFRFLPTLIAKPTYADTGDACFRFFINKIALRLYFNAGSAEYFFASPDKTQVIEGSLVSADVNTGNLTTGDATGDLQLLPELTIRNGTQTWIGDDWTIHAAYPPTNANQIGKVAPRYANDGVGLAYNGLPPATAIVENRSRYMMITANFFAVKTLDSIYGAHGLPRAFAFNGDFFYKIHTQPDPDKDQPRHVAYHHGHLALGFDDGRVDISVVGKPYSFDGALGASEWAIGDKVTGLLPLSGTILGVFGSKSIWGISGTTVDNFATQVITPNIGATEYTVTDMGFPVYANAYGVYTLAQTQQYGDYLGTPMSQDISPWLRPRLVRKYTSNKEVVVAWPVRSKNQYRLAFSDGYVMSMTLNAGQQSAPTFSFQKYTINE